MLSSSKNCMFIFKSQAAVRSRALGFTGEGAYNETYNHNKRKACNRNGREAGERICFQALSHAAPTASNNLSYRSGWGGTAGLHLHISLGQTAFDRPNSSLCHPTEQGAAVQLPAGRAQVSGPVTSEGHDLRRHRGKQSGLMWCWHSTSRDFTLQLLPLSWLSACCGESIQIKPGLQTEMLFLVIQVPFWNTKVPSWLRLHLGC